MAQKARNSLSAASNRIIAALTGTFLPSETAAEEPGIKAGVFTCHGLPNTGLNLPPCSSIDMRQVFITSRREENTSRGEENDRGRRGVGFGIDPAWRPESHMNFVVLMASTDVAVGAHPLAQDSGF